MSASCVWDLLGTVSVVIGSDGKQRSRRVLEKWINKCQTVLIIISYYGTNVFNVYKISEGKIIDSIDRNVLPSLTLRGLRC